MTDWVRGGFYFSLGLLSASTLGLASYFLADLRHEFALTSGLEGLAVSVITLVGATSAYMFGLLLTRISLGVSIGGGLVLLGASSLLTAIADTASAFLVTRIFAGVGFTLLVTALPVAIALLKTAAPRRCALTLWGSFLPLGIAFGVGLGAVSLVDWRTALAAHGVICLAAALVAFRLDHRHMTPRSPTAERAAPSVSILTDGKAMSFSMGFGAFAAVFLIVVVILPDYLRTSPAIDDRWAGIIAAFICAASALSGIALVWILPRIRNFFALFAIGLGGSAVAGSAFFLAPDVAAVGIVAGLIVALLSSLVSSTVFATLPLVVSAEKVGQLSGLVAQMGSLGSLIGPPLITSWTGAFGWGSGWLPFCALCILGIGLFVLPARHMRTVASGPLRA